jgi:hypothetical protein
MKANYPWPSISTRFPMPLHQMTWDPSLMFEGSPSFDQQLRPETPLTQPSNSPLAPATGHATTNRTTVLPDAHPTRTAENQVTSLGASGRPIETLRASSPPLPHATPRRTPRQQNTRLPPPLSLPATHTPNAHTETRVSACTKIDNTWTTTPPSATAASTANFVWLQRRPNPLGTDFLRFSREYVTKYLGKSIETSTDVNLWTRSEMDFFPKTENST